MIVQASPAQQQKYFCLHQLIPDAGRKEHNRYFRAFVLNEQEIYVLHQNEVHGRGLISNMPISVLLPSFLGKLRGKDGQRPLGTIAFSVHGDSASLWWYFSRPGTFGTGGFGYYSALLASQHLEAEGISSFSGNSGNKLSTRHFQRIGIFEDKKYPSGEWIGALEHGVEISKNIISERVRPHKTFLPMAESPV